MNRVTLDEGPGAEDVVVDIVNVSSEAAIGAGMAKSFLEGTGLLASDVVEVSVVTGGRYMLSKGVGLVLGGVFTASSSSSLSESEERPPSSSY